MGKLTPEEALQLGAGIAETWKVLASLLAEATETEAWVVAGYDRPVDWLGDPLPALPMVVGLEVELPVGGLTRRAAAKKAAPAKVSRPGKKEIARDRSLGRREVVPRFKAGGK